MAQRGGLSGICDRVEGYIQQAGSVGDAAKIPAFRKLVKSIPEWMDSHSSWTVDEANRAFLLYSRYIDLARLK